MTSRKIENLIILSVLFVVAYIFPQFKKTTDIQSPKVLSSNVNVSNILKPTKITQSGKIIKVIDGDTITVLLNEKNTKVRIIGINTPEVVDPRSPVECFGKEASEHAKIILDNQTVTLESDPTQSNVDRYGRILRYVYLSNNTDFGLKMIREGYAYEYTYNTPYKKQGQYRSAQKNAEVEKLGIWSSGICERVND